MLKRLLNASLLGMFALQMLTGLPSRAQALAMIQGTQEAGKRQQSAHRLLTQVLADLTTQYNADILFEPKALEGLRVKSGSVDKDRSLEQNLENLLTPLGLRYKKINPTSYTIRADKDGVARSLQPERGEGTRAMTKEAKPSGSEEAGSPEEKNSKPVPDRTVTGTVTDSDSKEPLPGVSVVVKGTTRGTTTDVNGSFRLTVEENGNAALVFSYVGYINQEVAIGNRSSIEIKLLPDLKSLDEVVVVGYGVQKKSDLTGSVGTVKSETLRERPVASLNQALSGRITGVNVSTNSGRPGGRANIRIRGNTSVSVANNPLYVIDGVILNAADLANGSTPIDFINPNDIASVEVLKDASATAIYGARGANGVILVTTKRGSTDGGRVTYDTEFSVGVLPRKLPLLNSAQFLQVEETAYQNAKKYDPVGWAGNKYRDPLAKRTNPLLFDASGKPLYDTDWQDEIYRPAKTQNHQLTFAGGNGEHNYGLYLGYRNEEGLMLESWLKRISGRFVMDSQIKKWLKVGGSIGYNNQNESQVDPLGNASITALRQVVEAIPIIPVKYPDGRWAGNEDYPGMEGGGNPVNIVNDRRYYLRTQTMLASVYTNITLAQGLELRTTVGANVINQRTDYYAGRTLNFISRNQGGEASITDERHNSWQFENYLTYNTKIAQAHTINALVGIAWQHVDRFSSRAGTQRFQDDYFQFNNLGTGSVVVAPASSTSAYGLNSYFGRINYGLKDRYLLTFTGRIDGSSKFGSAHQYALFPSAAFAWRVTEEEFMKKVPVVSNLKLRTSYGITGNSEITAYQALAGLGNYSVIFNNTRQVGIGVNRIANPDLRWEKTFQGDAGLELGLLNNRINLEVDVYRKLTTDMLLDAPVPSSSGFSTVSQNVGSMVNRGIEVGINTVNFNSRKLTWNTTFNISINKNEVTALNGGADIFPGPMDMSLIRVGEPVGTFYGYRRLGTWGTAEESEAAKYLKKPGDIKYLDVNGDGKINNNDQTIIGKGIPDGFGTLLNSFGYRNFNLTVDLQFMYGNDVFMFDRRPAEMRQGIANSYATVLQAWTPENQDTYIAEFRPVSAGYDALLDDFIVEDASFIRGRNLLLSYTFPNSRLERIQLSRLRLFASVQNFFLQTRYTGYDPEVSSHGLTFAQGIKLVDYPKPRVFMVGINIGL